MKKQAILNWSSGKDSAYTLYKVLQDSSIEVKYLFTTMNDELNRISMHGVRTSLLLKQIEAIGLPLKMLSLPSEPTLEEYDLLMKKSLKPLKEEGILLFNFRRYFFRGFAKVPGRKTGRGWTKRNVSTLANRFNSIDKRLYQTWLQSKNCFH